MQCLHLCTKQILLGVLCQTQENCACGVVEVVVEKLFGKLGVRLLIRCFIGF